MSNIICHLEHIPFPGPTTGVDGGFKIGMLSNGFSGTVSIIMWHNAASENVKPNCRLLCVYERGHKTSGAMTFTRHFIIEKVFLFPSHAGPVAIYACYDLEACSCLFTQGFFEYFFFGPFILLNALCHHSTNCMLKLTFRILPHCILLGKKFYKFPCKNMNFLIALFCWRVIGNC